MADLKEQHVYNKFCSRCGEKAMETYEMVKLVDNGKNTSIKQFLKFQNCVTSVEDAECLVSPPTSKTHENVMELVF
jgi:hypothetical protein